ncbi:MAG: GAF domain-containing sensor histidine kinase [Bacteroidota bacterium]
MEIAIENHENARLQSLQSYDLLDTLPETSFDNLTAIASEICQTPISLVSLIDAHRQWFKSVKGMQISETPREYAFCSYTIEKPHAVMEVEDARTDPRFSTNPFVQGDRPIVFYAGVPLVNDKGHVLGTLCVIDHHPRKLKESQLMALRALAHQVMELIELRKRQLELEVTASELTEVNKELEEFAYVAAHDLRSPLNSIAGLTSLLQDNADTKLGQEGRKYLDLIEGLSVKLKGTVDGLLEYSRSKKMLEEEQDQVIPELLVEELKDLISPTAPLTLRFNSDVDMLRVHRVALDQILLNLISNAIRYNDKPEAIIEVGLMEYEEDYQWYVEDNGPGVPEPLQPRIFDMFQVGGTHDKKGQTSTGIGLATVKRLVEAMGGVIRLISKPGQGATFHFSIPKIMPSY